MGIEACESYTKMLVNHNKGKEDEKNNKINSINCMKVIENMHIIGKNIITCALLLSINI